MKTCPGCGIDKPWGAYSKNRASRTGYAARCKSCCAEERLGYRHGITPEKYRSLLAAQNGRCAICQTTEPGKSTGHSSSYAFRIDHDHKCCPEKKSCGECVRGLLCHGCNVAIGLMKDSPDRMLQAAVYLLQHSDVLREV